MTPRTCITRGCERARVEPTEGIAHAHCSDCERRLLREAFGPVTWFERALTGTLPSLVIGGVPVRTRA
jgi:hypothetical protein